MEFTQLVKHIETKYKEKYVPPKKSDKKVIYFESKYSKLLYSSPSKSIDENIEALKNMDHFMKLVKKNNINGKSNNSYRVYDYSHNHNSSLIDAIDLVTKKCKDEEIEIIF